MECHGNECDPGCKGMKMVVLGLILAANEYYFKINWWYLFAGLLCLKGLIVMMFKGCMCHNMQPKKAEPVKKGK